jgi:hypothetical protein
VDSKNTDNSMKASIEMEIGEETLTRILNEAEEEIGSLTKALQF